MLQKLVMVSLLAVVTGQSVVPRLLSAPNVVIWDTVAPLPVTADGTDRSGWKAVPSDLLTLEADPPKASSDPGYYGREYTFKGDVVVENQSLAPASRKTSCHR